MTTTRPMAFQWNPGELDRLQLSIAADGTGDTACEVCGRWISTHDPAVDFCAPSSRRFTGQRRRLRVDLLDVIAVERSRFAAQRRAYPRSASLQTSMYGWVLRLQKDASGQLRRCDQLVAPVRLRTAA